MSKRGTTEPVTKTVFLTGFMGVGKTTVGTLLAGRLRIPFVDSDRLIEKETGLKVADIFAQQGEPAFRALERKTIAELARSADPRVVGLGGGAILDPQNQKVILGAGVLVWLQAQPETILERVSREPGDRPLLGDSASSEEERLERIRKLLQTRQVIYGLAQIQVVTDGKSREQVAEEIVGLLK